MMKKTSASYLNVFLNHAIPNQHLECGRASYGIKMDLSFPQMKDLEAISAFKAAIPASQIVVLSNYEVNDETFRALLAAHGASGYLPKKAMLGELKPLLTELLLLAETNFPGTV